MIDFMFVALGFFAITGAIAMLLYKSPIYAALGLLISVLSIGGLFALLSASFMFMVQLIVYAGAILTLLLFILMYLNINEEDLPKEPNRNFLIGLGIAIMVPINALILDAVSKLPAADMSVVAEGFGGIKELGLKLFTEWLVPFELISILLLVALVGAIVLAKKKDRKELN
ncbi:NADH-quinone oxidoreductase subunit J [Candidatus Marinarcus aquaticus]|uniref:NADH-quinone oxidoreductase subunit J n=1 Tax=Candidatus Marinarcus aquaticus TaxID=2044504 RepID=A0A4Q0XSQ9_9BACT|nr:NADH-quinone oxidoreductase subunit J [Candidatus Marinarcus aquaticus]RXJ56503.1 NADH-quinone oxidoreductase subunit J [Candidatus Marinarcus aquaticus]